MPCRYRRLHTYAPLIARLMVLPAGLLAVLLGG
jgi:hypothetical protein